MLVYLGVALLLAGASTTIVTSLETEANGFYLVFGAVMASMGLVLSFAALKADDGSADEATLTYPLSYAEFELGSYQERAKKISGNRAFGFILISMALFVLTVSGLFGFFFLWPLTMLGACCITGGAILCMRK